jgi:hypothetical protein
MSINTAKARPMKVLAKVMVMELSQTDNYETLYRFTG